MHQLVNQVRGGGQSVPMCIGLQGTIESMIMQDAKQTRANETNEGPEASEAQITAARQ